MKEELLYVNQQLRVSVKLGSGSAKMQPDVLIVKNDTVLNFIDLKMDLCYNRKKFVDLFIKGRSLKSIN